MMKKNILFFHQSADLYGSDKTLLYLVSKIDKNKFNPIVVIPNKGPLFYELKKNKIFTIITPVLNIHRKMFSLKTIFLFPYQLITSFIKLNRELKNIKIAIIHTNTAVVLLGFIYAKVKKSKHFWHIHEMIESREIIVKLYSNLLYKFSDKVIFNSKATEESFCKYKKQLKDKSLVIYNGITREKPFSTKEEKLKLKEQYTINKTHILLGLIGRINNNKGHLFLLKAFERILSKNPKITLLFIGSTVLGKEYLLNQLEEEINIKNLSKNVKIIPFQKDIWQFWDLIDVAVVPTISSESFGLVALEAMLAKKPVVASKIGGLKEIVRHNKSGFLCTINQEEFVSAINNLIENESLRISFGENGYSIAQKEFPLKKYIESFESLYLT